MKKLIVIIFILLIFTGCQSSAKVVEEVFETKEEVKGVSNITNYTIYGRFFNLEGELDGNYDTLSLILKDKDLELEYPLIIEKQDNKTIYKTNKLINEGINLEKIKTGNYLIYLKENDNYYTLNNSTNYKDLEYYTITNNKKNNKITINFKKIDNNYYLLLNSIETKLPKEIYDIVIDPGHGGKDVGATSGSNHESKFNLDYSLLLKEELEKLGLKVKLTRTKDESISNYGKNGRVSIPYITKAKLMLSIHMNSAKGIKNGGVEIYVPNHANNKFAKSIADNIVNNTSSNYSPNQSDKKENGVYLRTLTKNDLKEIETDAKKDGYKPYEKATTDSTYYYIIRETGGIITGAYIDNRNPKKEGNPYYNSNHGCESYLLELGYINSSSNLNILLKEKEKYVEAIVKSVKEYLELI